MCFKTAVLLLRFLLGKGVNALFETEECMY